MPSHYPSRPTKYWIRGSRFRFFCTEGFFRGKQTVVSWTQGTQLGEERFAPSLCKTERFN